MTDGPFPIAADAPIRETVTAVLTLIDGFSRRPVRSGVSAILWDPLAGIRLAGRIVRNRSGSLVLVDLPRDVPYTFLVDPRAARYRGPFEVSFTPIDGQLEQVVRLEPLATFPFDPAVTVIRGMVATGRTADGTDRPVPAPGVTVTAVVDGAGPTARWVTTTDDRGGFALPLALPVPPGEVPAPQTVRLTFDRGGVPVSINRQLTEGRTHVFAGVIDLASAAPLPQLSVE